MFDGLGHTMSFLSSGQNSLILSNRYCWRSCDSPFGNTTEGSCWEGGRQDKSLISLSGEVLTSFTNTFPGWNRENQKWWSCVIPFSAVFTVFSSKNVLQSYVGTNFVLSSEPTSCGTLTNDDRLVQLAILSKSPILVRRKHCFSRPNDQSGANLVWPTMRKDIFISSCKPVRHHHIR